MRPSSIDEIVGQDHLLGPGCSLRLLVESDAMVSMIFWGPPGTGKTSLARAIARSVSCRFVTASAITSGVKEVREILEEAKRSKTTGLRTLLFFDEVHRFNKAQQDVFLPYIEAGHVIFMGATIENPSFEVNAALLSRCKVLTLNKLQAQDIRQVLDRALTCSERGVIVPFMDDSLVQKIEIEEDAMHILSESADGDARVALNILEVAVASAVARKRKQNKVVHEDSVQSLPSLAMVDSQLENPVISRKTGMVRFSCSPNLSCESHSTVFEGEHQRPSKRSVRDRDMNTDDGRESEAQNMTDELQSNCLSLTVTDPKGSYLAMDQPSVMEKPNSNTIISVKVMDVSGSLQRSHVLYDKKGEEHYNIISALHKSMRGGDPDAALYWLSRMLEGGEGPLYIARRLIRFASEDIGLADSQAIMLAVACYQACHFLGMPECNVHLAHCVAYLALAPKSVAVYQAIESAQQHVKQGENEPVPLHLRNAPTGLMKQLGYGRGYIYPPNHEGLIKQEYMPPSLRGHKFLKWP
ncbi:hypothetical protein KP509_18G033800 [Ceratopteris richardii]|nr:hypothetical protein KP509_18G033800 [Ceratopteris richardii]